MGSIINVLVIEDDTRAASAVTLMLQTHPRASFAVICAGTLAEGLQRIHERPFDAVVLDLGLPDSQGLGTIETLTAQAPHLPIIVTTGLTDENLSFQALAKARFLSLFICILFFCNVLQKKPISRLWLQSDSQQIQYALLIGLRNADLVEF
jgi:CheY-like chemotaxis protein